MPAKKLSLLIAVCAAASLLHAATLPETALDRYVSTPDPHYRYDLALTIPGHGWTAYVLDMTSQQWRSEREVDRPIWKHWMVIVKPERVTSSVGFLHITGGDNTDSPPNQPDESLVRLATATNTVVSEIRMVPNQPLTFRDDQVQRSEDAIIVYSWDKFLRGGDDQWPLRLPMTKAAVRAMDTVTDFCRSRLRVNVNNFVVSGASKRGWTTWATAAVDPRVTAIIPLVIDVLNVETSFQHHFQALGFWAPAVHDYEEAGIMNWMDTPEYRKLMEIEDPYSYRCRLTMPKLLINATGDEFFLPDSSRFYWDDLQGEKYLRYVPNANHSLDGTDALDSIESFYASVVERLPRPRMNWTFDADGGITLRSEDRPERVLLWQATNAKARDFRVDTIGKAYRASALEDRGGGTYVAHVRPPRAGWTAYFVEATYQVGGRPLKLTSGVRVTPDTLPYPRPKPRRP